MGNILKLRAHHFLCLPGYKGYNYSNGQVNSWNQISKLLKEKPNTKVQIVTGEDSLCLGCPNNSKNGKLCNQPLLEKLDEKVQKLLGLILNKVYKFDELLKKLRSILNPEKHAELCGKCEWRKMGLCKDTFKKSN